MLEKQWISAETIGQWRLRAKRGMHYLRRHNPRRPRAKEEIIKELRQGSHKIYGTSAFSF